MLRGTGLLLVLCGGCGHDDAKAPPPEPVPPVATPKQPVSMNAGTPRAPAGVFGDMALIPKREGVDAFYLDLTEVTVRDYEECVKRGACSTPSTAPGCDGLPNNFANKRSLHPVNCVTDVDAWNYCRFRGKRLPSHAEFDAAVEDDWGRSDPTCAQAVLAGCGDAGTSPVGSKPAGRSKQGLFDLVGNVSEIYGTNGEPYDAIIRYHSTHVNSIGGNYATTPPNSSHLPGPEAPNPQVGFRCASSLPGQPQIARY